MTKANDGSSPRWTPREGFRKYAVTDVNSAEAFARRYYKSDRFLERGPEYMAAVLASNRTLLAEYGVCWISQYDSVTGSVVAFYEGMKSEKGGQRQ